MIRTRLAASPTGYPHIGTIYQALFDYVFAKKHNGKFLVRIDDTDRSRFVEGSEDVIFNSLDWFGLIEDESPRKDGKFKPYRQSERLEIYHQYAMNLVNNKQAYFSYFPKAGAGIKKDYSKINTFESKLTIDQSPPKSIDEMIKRGDWVLRLKVPIGEIVSFNDLIRGEISFESSDVTEQVLLKSDGYPTYHLASVIDDHLMQISHIIRAEEWLSSTPKHVLLYKYFGWEMPLVCHTATLRNPDKSKLSKRHGHTNIAWFREEGFLPDAILNFLALLGWSHPDEKEIFDLKEFTELFDIKDIRPVAPIFDLVKLRWMNQQYIQMKSNADIKKLILGYSKKAKLIDEAILDQIVPLLKTRMETLSDFEKQAGIFWGEFGYLNFNTDEKNLARILNQEIVGIKEWRRDTIFEVMKKLLTKHKIKMSVFYRILTGFDKGLPLPESLEIYGRDNTVKRLEEVVGHD